MALILALPGIANLVLFPVHAATHEYWMYYLTPSIALLAGSLIHAASILRTLPWVLVLVMCAPAWTTAISRMEASRTGHFVVLADAIDGLAPPEDVLALPWPAQVERYYFSHDCLDGIQSREDLEHLQQLQAGGHFGARRITFVFPERLASVFPDVAANLFRFGPVHRLNPEEIRQLPPILQPLLASRGLSLLRMGGS